jgi:hypothetical protein
MASQKVRPPALQRLFKTSTQNMYAFTLEQPLRLGARIFYLAIFFVFASPSKSTNIPYDNLCHLSIFAKHAKIMSQRP